MSRGGGGGGGRSLLLVGRGKQSPLLSRGVKEMPGDLFRYLEVKELLFSREIGGSFLQFSTIR